jgi:hypothetical protein
MDVRHDLAAVGQAVPACLNYLIHQWTFGMTWQQ